MKAIIVQESKRAAVVEDAPVPALRDDYVKVKTVAVALNPTDWKHIDFITDPGAYVGCDFSGVVVEIGKSVKKSVKEGDKIYGIVHGSNISNHEDGAFGEYLVVKDGTFAKVPEGLSMTDVASFGVGITTCGQGLYLALGLPLPTEPTKNPFPILIYGGATATGALAIQYAKLSGLTVITTASARNHAMLKKLGADACFDYNEPSAAASIREYTNNDLRYAFDTITLEPTIRFCAEALSSNNDQEIKYSALLPVKFPRSDVQAGSTMAYTAFGEAYTKRGKEFPAKPDHYDQARMFWALSEKLVADGKLKAHPVTIGKGGLQGVLDGLQQMRENKISGTKLVYKIDETT